LRNTRGLGGQGAGESRVDFSALSEKRAQKKGLERGKRGQKEIEGEKGESGGGMLEQGAGRIERDTQNKKTRPTSSAQRHNRPENEEGGQKTTKCTQGRGEWVM